MTKQGGKDILVKGDKKAKCDSVAEFQELPKAKRDKLLEGFKGTRVVD